MSIGAITSFLIFYGLENATYLEHLDANYYLSQKWEFELKDCGVAVVIGAFSSVLALMTLLTVGITKQLLLRIEQKVKAVGLPSKIIVCTIGGICIGTVNWALPLTVGNGNQVTKALIQLSPNLSNGLLWSTVFARMFTLGVSMNCGFVGGFIFPMITIGMIVGVICHNNYNEYPLALTMSCFLAAVPSGICPMPFTMLGIACFIFFLGLQQTVPIFISCITSYTLFTGLGIFGALAPKPAPDQEDSYKKDEPDDNMGKYNSKSSRASLLGKS